MRENRPLSGGFTGSPRFSASCRSRAASSSSSFVGTSTTSWARRSPRPRPCSLGTPRLRSVNSRPGCVPGRDVELLVAVERRQRHRRAERGLGDRDRDLGHEVVAVAPVPLVLGDAQVHVQVARPAAAGAGRAAPGQAQRRAGVDAGGHVDLVGVLGGDAALAAARRARCDDDLAEPAAARARTRRHHLAEQALADPLHLPRPAAVGARDRLGARAGAGAAAVGAALRQAQRHRHRGAEHGLLELDVGDDLHVLAPRRAGRAAPAGAAAAERVLAAEERVEQVVQAAAGEDVVGPWPPPRRAADAGLAEAVVAGPLVGVGQHLVRPGDLLELLGGGRVGVGVGVQLARLLAVRPLQLLGRGGARHAEQVVEVGHQLSSSRRPSWSLTTSTVAMAWG